jgi:hypothetical protein
MNTQSNKIAESKWMLKGELLVLSRIIPEKNTGIIKTLQKWLLYENKHRSVFA